MEPHLPIVLGIESSCDDTSAAVVVGSEVRSNCTASQRVHADFGGVVPELASRAHQLLIVPVVEAALAEAGIGKHELDAVAVTYGPGLAGSLLVGLSFAKAFALGLGKTLVGINHLEGHMYSTFIEPPGPAFPYLCLIVSGGHTQLVLVEEGFRHTLMGRTRDDAAGEAFDKVGKLLGLSYPAGSEVDRLARDGDPAFHAFPRTRLKRYDFSFSGIKTAVLYYLNNFSETERAQLLEDHLPDLCAAFQEAVVEMLIGPLRAAMRKTGVQQVALVGGVSANSVLRSSVRAICERAEVAFFTPTTAFCTDNAAMIAVTAAHKFAAGYTSPLSLTAAPGLDL